ncbi:MAG: hypothetical protein FJ398_24130 [Verrucomicrobia bacterium]|nr:hypothetical protein [Verrucomicrobiota bacterium]
MNFFKAVLAWSLIMLVLGFGLYEFTIWLIPPPGSPPGAGSPWLLILGVLGFCVAVGRVCCKSH